MSNQVYANSTTPYAVVPLTADGPVSLFSSQQSLKIYNWTLQTVGATTASYAMPVTVGRPITVKSYVSAIVSSGTAVNAALSRQTSSLFNAVSGAVTFVSDYQQLTSNENAATNGVALQHLGAATNVTAAVSGVAGSTITYRGVTYIYE